MSAPSSPVRDLERTAGVLRLVCQTTLGLSVLLAVSAPFIYDDPGWLIAVDAMVAATMLSSLGLLARGHVSAASLLVVSVTWLTITVSAWFLGGAHSSSYLAYVGVIAFSGFFLERRPFFALVALTVATGGAMAWAGSRSLLPEPLVAVSVVQLWQAMAGASVVTALVLDRAVSTTRASLREAERRVEEQAAIAALGEQALASPDLQSLFDDTVRLVARTVGCDFCKVLELERGDETLLVRAGVGWKPGTVGEARVVTHRGSQAGYTLDHEGPVIVEDFAEERRFEAPSLLSDHGVVSGVSHTIRGPDGAWGVLGAHHGAARRFLPEGVHFIQAAANLLSAAVTRTLLEKRVRDGEKLETVSQLAGGVAHDFNNLLTVIRGYAEQLADRGGSADDVREASSEIVAAADRASVLTTRMLALTRDHEVTTVPVDLGEVVGALFETLRKVAGEHIETRLELDAELPPVLADPVEIEQILLNLVVNARDAMPEGGELDIEVRGGSTLRIAVTDTGTGMDSALQEQVFDPFFTTKASGRGTGLGLASVRGIARRLGGEARVASEPGRGSRFEIDLPGTDALLEPRAEREPKRAAPGGETVLVVEDDDALRALLVRVLEEHGYSVFEASDGAAGLAIAGQHDRAIHVVLTDAVMPRMGGVELAERLRRDGVTAPCIVMSGYRESPPGDRAMPPGTRLLRKPFRTTDLLARLSSTLAG